LRLRAFNRKTRKEVPQSSQRKQGNPTCLMRQKPPRARHCNSIFFAAFAIPSRTSRLRAFARRARKKLPQSSHRKQRNPAALDILLRILQNTESHP
jgi:hypothetical protein